MNAFTFNGKSSADFGVIVSGTQTFVAPSRDVEYISIPGRNGSLTLDNGKWNDIDIVYPCLILDNFDVMFPQFRAWLMSCIGRYELTDTYDEETFRLASFSGDLSPNTAIRNKVGKFDVVFHCYPQKFLKSGETFVNMVSNDTIVNPTLYPSKPLLHVAMAGGASGTLTFGGQTITITDSPSNYVYIDCDRQEVYYQSTNLNQYVTLTTGGFPELASGSNTLTFTGGITRVAVKPRWWTL